MLALIFGLSVVNGYFAIDGEPPRFIVGAGSPETLASPRHGWEAHGGTLAGALDYLVSEEVGAIYWTPQNAGADGDPDWFVSLWTDPRDARSMIDPAALGRVDAIARLAWSRGILSELVTQERENDEEPVPFHDGGDLSPQRVRYYDALIGAMGDLPMIFNLGEECGLDPDELNAAANYVGPRAPGWVVVVHQYPGEEDRVFGEVVANEWVGGFSIQSADPEESADKVARWRAESLALGIDRAVYISETGPWHTGVPADGGDLSETLVALWGSVMAGGAAFYAYFGYQTDCHDLDCSDFSTRSEFWALARIAKSVLSEVDLAGVEPVEPTGSVGSANPPVLLDKRRSLVSFLERGESVCLLLGADGFAPARIEYVDPETGARYAGAIWTGSPGEIKISAPPFEGPAVILARKIEPTPTPTPNHARDWAIYE